MYLSIYHIIEMLFTKPQIGRIRYNMFFFSYVMLNCWVFAARAGLYSAGRISLSNDFLATLRKVIKTWKLVHTLYGKKNRIYLQSECTALQSFLSRLILLYMSYGGRKRGSADPAPCWTFVVKRGKHSPFRGKKEVSFHNWDIPCSGVCWKMYSLPYQWSYFYTMPAQLVSMGEESTELWERGSYIGGP